MSFNTTGSNGPERPRLKAYNIFTVLAMSFASLSFGYSNNIIATTLAQPTFIKYFQLDTRKNATQIEGAMTGVYHAAAFVGVFFVGTLADRWGRRAAISVGAILTLVSGAFLAGSVNVGMFIFFRVVSGAGSSILLSGVPLWMNEVVPAEHRGPLVDIHGAVFQFGFAVASWAGFGFYFMTSNTTNAWRAPLAFQCLAPTITLAIIYWLPESPRWLLMKDRVEDARKVLLRTHSTEEALEQITQIHSQMQIERSLKNSYVHMFTKQSYRKRCLLAIGTCVFANCSGILVVNNYGPTIYSSLGYDSNKQLLLSAVWSTFSILCSVAGMGFVDKMSRPRLLTLGLIGCTVCLIVLAALVANISASPNFPLLRAAVTMIFIYAFFWSGVLSGTQFLYCGELFPSHIRAKGLSLGVAGINLANIVFLTVAPVAFHNVGWKYYLLFIITSGLSAILIHFFWPETRGLRLEEISALFGDNDEMSKDGIDHAHQEMAVEKVISIEKGEVKQLEYAEENVV